MIYLGRLLNVEECIILYIKLVFFGFRDNFFKFWGVKENSFYILCRLWIIDLIEL